MKFFYLSFSFHDMQIGCFAFLSLASIIVQLESALNNLYSHTWNQSIILCKLWVNLIHNRWLFTKYVLFVFSLLNFLYVNAHYFHWYVVFFYWKYWTAM